MITNHYPAQTHLPLTTPTTLMKSLPVSDLAKKTIEQTRREANAIMQAKDNRLLVIVGPCSIHDIPSALEYAEHLKRAGTLYRDKLLLIMRVYLEKPRTSTGWRGLINDPHLDGSHDIPHGLRTSRELLCRLNEMGVPCAMEFLDPITPQYLSDLISWAVIGARTAESQLHRQIASGLSLPVGVKNSTDGNVQIALDALKTASQPQHYLSISASGNPTIIHTTGNQLGYVILRGSRHSTNYHESDVCHVSLALKEANLNPHIIVDCSHGNSQRNYLQQIQVADAVAKQIKAGNSPIHGVMLESHLHAGKQSLQLGQPLEYGKSITDACLSWEETLPILERLAGI